MGQRLGAKVRPQKTVGSFHLSQTAHNQITNELVQFRYQGPRRRSATIRRARWAARQRETARERNKKMADRVGFEPTRRVNAYTLSKRAPSTTRPPVLTSFMSSSGVEGSQKTAHAILF